MLDHFNDIKNIQRVLKEAQTGLWAIELDTDAVPRMYVDAAMLALLGLKEPLSPEDCYAYWYGRIVRDFYPMIQAAIEKLISDNRTEVQYSWIHPKWGQIYVRCGGIRDWSYGKGICLRGYHQNITDTIILKQEYDAVIESLSESYKGIFLCNLQDGSYKVIKMPEVFYHLALPNTTYEDILNSYVNVDVALEYRGRVLKLADRAAIQKKIQDGKKRIECLYQNVQGGWRRICLLAGTEYSTAHPWVIATIDEQDDEIEKRLKEVMAKAALANIYKLVISIDMRKTDYYCIQYSGNLLHLQHHGYYEDFYSQMEAKMPEEDRVTLAQIFNLENYQYNDYLEGVLRRWDEEGTLHYYAYYASCIQQDTGERILFSLRNIDDKQENHQREHVLSNLCKCYYSIYLFDIEHNVEEAIWQEEYISRKQEFPKGPLDEYYEKFIQNYVYHEDQDKMRRAGSADFLRKTLTAAQPVYDIDFRRVYTDSLQWVRSRFSIAETVDGRLTKVIFANMNIHDQKEKEMEEEKQKKLYVESRNIIQGLSSFYHSVYYVDLLSGSFQSFRQMQDIAGYLGRQIDYRYLINMYCDRLIKEEDKERFSRELSIQEICRRIMAGETIFSMEYRRNYGGYYGWMRLYIILAESRNGIPVKIILAAHNVEEEKEQEEQNKQTLMAAYEAAKMANEAKSNFLAQMSHDIRTPLNAIVGMSAIAAAHLEETERIKDCLEKINISSKHLLGLINEILDMSKIEKGKIELLEAPFHIEELMRSLHSMIKTEAEEKGHELQYQFIELKHKALIGDVGRIQQILLNLLNNAVKYTPAGGKITVTVQEVAARAKGLGCFIFTVEDTGIGMSEAFIDHIFEPFVRADDARIIQGTGLGMPIALGIAATMQGTIQVESKKGVGSKFIVTLYLKIAEEAQQIEKVEQNTEMKKESSIKSSRGFMGKRLLLAEDNILNMEIAQTILEEAGFLIDCAANGQEACALFLSSKPSCYSAILMDLQMPVMDGYEAAKKIRGSAHPDARQIPIIALTANAFAEDIAKVLTIGMNEHVAKPIDYDRLFDVLYKHIY